MLLVPTDSPALVIQVKMTCPICGGQLLAIYGLSEFQTGMRLDLKPLGPDAGPPPLPVFPTCHFVIYEEKIPEAEKQILAEFIKSEDYQILASAFVCSLPDSFLLAAP
jgi:hypothetical protein